MLAPAVAFTDHSQEARVQQARSESPSPPFFAITIQATSDPSSVPVGVGS